MRPAFKLLSAVALSSLSAFGQGSVVIVDATAGPITSIQAGIDAANAGDTVLVKTGSYQGFTVIGKGLTITGELNHVVNVIGTMLIANLAAGSFVAVRGITVTVPFVPGVLTPPPTLVNNAGMVWVEDCTIVDNNLGITFSGYQGHGVAVQNCVSVAFTRCSITGSPGAPSGEGIHSDSSSVSIHDCTVRGADSAISVSQPLAGGDGATVSGGFLFASGTTFRGGKGSPGVSIGGPGIPTVCHNGGPGGNGIRLSGSSPAADVLACSFVPGVGGLGQANHGCSDGAPGQPMVVSSGFVTTLTGVARHYSATSPVRGGQSTTLVFHGPVGEGAWIAYWTSPANVFLPSFLGPLLVGGPPNLASMGTMPASEVLTVPITAPDPTPALTGMTFFSQSVFLAGSSIFLGCASEVTVVNSATP